MALGPGQAQPGELAAAPIFGRPPLPYYETEKIVSRKERYLVCMLIDHYSRKGEFRCNARNLSRYPDLPGRALFVRPPKFVLFGSQLGFCCLQGSQGSVDPVSLAKPPKPAFLARTEGPHEVPTETPEDPPTQSVKTEKKPQCRFSLFSVFVSSQVSPGPYLSHELARPMGRNFSLAQRVILVRFPSRFLKCPNHGRFAGCFRSRAVRQVPRFGAGRFP